MTTTELPDYLASLRPFWDDARITGISRAPDRACLMIHLEGGMRHAGGVTQNEDEAVAMVRAIADAENREFDLVSPALRCRLSSIGARFAAVGSPVASGIAWVIRKATHEEDPLAGTST